MANEKRFDLIDRQALGIGKAKREAFENPAYADGWNSAIAIVENAPTVDAVEVVRCKDCKYFDPNRALTVSAIWCSYWAIDPDPDDFCCKGERRSDGNL